MPSKIGRTIVGGVVVLAAVLGSARAAQADQICATVTVYVFTPPATAEVCVPVPNDFPPEP